MFTREPFRASGGPGKLKGQVRAQGPSGCGAVFRLAPPSPGGLDDSPHLSRTSGRTQSHGEHASQHGPQITSMLWRQGASGRPWWCPPRLLDSPGGIRQFSCASEGPRQTQSWRPRSSLTGFLDENAFIETSFSTCPVQTLSTLLRGLSWPPLQ